MRQNLERSARLGIQEQSGYLHSDERDRRGFRRCTYDRLTELINPLSSKYLLLESDRRSSA
jgi:hypothetical protein